MPDEFSPLRRPRSQSPPGFTHRVRSGSLLILGLLAWIIMTLAQQGIFEGRRWAIFTRGRRLALLGNGLGATLSAAALAAVIAFPLGLMLCLLRISLVA